MSDPVKSPPIKLEETRELKLPFPVLGLDVHEDSIFAACLDGGVYHCKSTETTPLKIAHHKSYASGVAAIRGDLIISAGYDGCLLWIDPAAPSVQRTVRAHDFWSWQMASSPDKKLIASVTGQYLVGTYKYEPAPEKEPSVKLFSATTGEVVHKFSHLPPVKSVAWSPDNKFLAAGNLMGEVKVWNIETGKETASWKTESFTGWGIIKGHYYTGGIAAMVFSPDTEKLYVCGMGSTTDPAAATGRQLWQAYAWRDGKKLDETHEGENGGGLMETIEFAPDGARFVMAGHIFKGKWNTAVFDVATGALIHSLDTKMRVNKVRFSKDGEQLYIAGAVDQGKKKDGKYPASGRIKIFHLT